MSTTRYLSYISPRTVITALLPIEFTAGQKIVGYNRLNPQSRGVKLRAVPPPPPVCSPSERLAAMSADKA